MLATIVLCSLALGQAPPPPTLTPEDLYKSRVVTKYAGQRVRFRGWLRDIHHNEKQKVFIHDVQTTYQPPQGESRTVSAGVCFARDLVGLRNQFQRAERNGERLLVLVEGKVVKYPVGWRLEEAKLISARAHPRGR